MKFMSYWVLFLGLPCARSLVFDHSRRTSLVEVSLSRCMDDPDSCAAGVDQMRETASTIKKQVHEELNATRIRFHTVKVDFIGCNTLMRQVSTYRSSFKAKAESHRLCRGKQQADYDASMMCLKYLTAVKSNRTLLCNRESLTQSASDLVALCAPTVREPVGMWLEDMVQTFRTRYTQWTKENHECEEAEKVIPGQESKCNIAASALHQREEQCGRELDSVESFSCSWATGFASRCSSYDTCFASVLTRHSDAVREANASVVRWKKSWLAASRMECMANAMNASGSVDEGKLHLCNGANITNMSFIKLVIDVPPAKTMCPVPEIYPGSVLFREQIYGTLPGDLTVREPTPCPWKGSSRPKKIAFSLWRNNPVAINMGPDTPSGQTELRVFLVKESENYMTSRNVTTALHSTTFASEWAFDEMTNGDLMAIKMGPKTGTGKTEVHILSARSQWNQFQLHTGTGLHLTDREHGQWAFQVMRNNDLMAIKMGPVTGTGKTEVHILSASSRYQSFRLHTGTGLHLTDRQHGQWDFQVMRNNDLMAIKMGPTTGTGKTEVHILSESSRYQVFSLQTGTGLQLTDQNHGQWAFELMDNDDLMAIETVPESGSGMIKVHILSASSKYRRFSRQDVKSLASE
eukprot:CAMPEP_0194503282 /NCGR_PEP_ID=MMETSP0253-20130528/28294_1 /TAXON_ID=2966 /ORGANISM="Noctiluca scintillans" /LENGTH=633 /DNA_ID=CAMNT_0039345553 /DNA_START=14 /DNA_END=1915 /DNA_ORIENTATION=-